MLSLLIVSLSKLVDVVREWGWIAAAAAAAAAVTTTVAATATLDIIGRVREFFGIATSQMGWALANMYFAKVHPSRRHTGEAHAHTHAQAGERAAGWRTPRTMHLFLTTRWFPHWARPRATRGHKLSRATGAPSSRCSCASTDSTHVNAPGGPR